MTEKSFLLPQEKPISLAHVPGVEPEKTHAETKPNTLTIRVGYVPGPASTIQERIAAIRAEWRAVKKGWFQ
jgi:hypothetical protein